MKTSPYLKDPDRLADVIAAIQTLGSYRFYRLSPEKWSHRISGSNKKIGRWRAVFREHPEFFRFSGDQTTVCLVLRRQKPKLFDVDSLEIVSREDRESRSEEGKARVSRAPLSEMELNLLVDLAIKLHSKSLENKRDSRWWIPLLAAALSAISGLVGVVVGSKLKSGE